MGVILNATHPWLTGQFGDGVTIQERSVLQLEALPGCWFRLQVAFPGGVQDTPTWTAQITGDPIRLVT